MSYHDDAETTEKTGPHTDATRTIEGVLYHLATNHPMSHCTDEDLHRFTTTPPFIGDAADQAYALICARKTLGIEVN